MKSLTSALSRMQTTNGLESYPMVENQTNSRLLANHQQFSLFRRINPFAFIVGVQSIKGGGFDHWIYSRYTQSRAMGIRHNPLLLKSACIKGTDPINSKPHSK